MELATALQNLGEALLKADAGGIESAAQDAAEALRALETYPQDREALKHLAELNRRNGALLAARHAGLQWALSRMTPGARTYGSDGQQALAPPPRRLATA